MAGHLGCFIHLKDSVNAIAFVALGTSVPGRHWHENCVNILAFNVPNMKGKEAFCVLYITNKKTVCAYCKLKACFCDRCVCKNLYPT